MIKSISINRFKGFLNFEVQGLSRVTLIGGQNSIGKTSLLEAVFLFFGRNLADVFIRLLSWRGVPGVSLLGDDMVAPFFMDYDASREMEIGLKFDTGMERLRLSFDSAGRSKVLRDQHPRRGNGVSYMPTDHRVAAGFAVEMKYKSPHKSDGTAHLLAGTETPIEILPGPGFSEERHCIFLQTCRSIDPAEDALHWGDLDRVGKAECAVEFLKEFFPSLRGLSLIPLAGGQPIIYADVGLARKTPAGCVGDGFSRLLSIFLAIASCENGVVLVDEIGGGLYYSAQAKVWRGVEEAARHYNCQVIATTHSYEIIKAANEGLQGSLVEPEFSYVRLEKGDKGIEAKTYPFSVLGAALERGWEVR